MFTDPQSKKPTANTPSSLIPKKLSNLLGGMRLEVVKVLQANRILSELLYWPLAGSG